LERNLVSRQIIIWSSEIPENCHESERRDGSEPKPGTNSISNGTKFVPVRFLSSKVMKIWRQNIQKRKIADLQKK